MYDEDEDLFADIVDAYAEMQYKCVEAVLATGAKFDFGHYWEDICFNGGPLLSPAVFEELCVKHYKRRNELCRKYGIDLISLDCDGVTDKLLPYWYESGVNIMFPIEIGTWGDQFEPARKKYGESMLGVGAMDKTALRKDKAAAEFFGNCGFLEDLPAEEKTIFEEGFKIVNTVEREEWVSAGAIPGSGPHLRQDPAA